MRHIISSLSTAGVVILALLLFQFTSLQAAELPAFAELVKENRAAVVNISTMELKGTREERSFGRRDFPDLPENSPFREFFKRFFENPEGNIPEFPSEPRGQSLGSGFIISPDGYILTNAHVVKNADSIIVRLSDNAEKTAKLVGTDERTDVALLKIDAKDLPTVRIGNSDSLEVGEWVLAIGSPFGLEYTATQGIISALGRSLPQDVYVPFIQTDVAVNPGNSGGPLFNTQGEVIGVNAQIYSNTGGYMGLSFAIPINVAMQITDQLKVQGYVTRGWLGVLIQPVNQALAESFGIDQTKGALVAQVIPNSPASKAGFKPGDIIVKYNGKPVHESSQLPLMVGSTAVHTTIPVTILRDGKTKELEVTIEKLAEGNEATQGPALASHKENRLNIIVADLSPEQRESKGLGEKGVLIKEVGEDGPAAKAGIRVGDVILTLNGEDIKDVKQLARVVKTLPEDKPVPVLVQRGEDNLFLALRTSSK
jgi:periplasmic serine protease, Do/DeqQ family